MTFPDVALETIDGKVTSLRDYPAQLYLIVNTASECVFTPQYRELEDLYGEFKDRGLVVLGFPCNQFGSQESESNERIADFCMARFQTSFPMFARTEVNGPHAHPLFKFLTAQAPGLFNSRSIKWNFTKFLVDPSKASVERFAPQTSPVKLRDRIAKALQSACEI